ncbi:hypothetical protein AA0119_g12371 [Alternaria tenuissima]|uniref:Zn(2)-C6 fungal-type domain-containing protein n=1 Tax=Alternaria tenuissima TaxID=119927 RepID=A0ABY0FRG3_9PLEO|nr:hypothetical protein AA0119_g12371 [Alternaria tenuissima]
MANEEQRRAFESYMGRTGGSGSGSGSNGQDQNQGQPIPQYPGSFAQPANSYLFSQSPGLGIPPAAPTPPPAASSSVASFPGYQGGYPQAGCGQGTYSQTGIPQRPAPLLDPQTQQQGQQQISTAGPLGYAQLPRNYNPQPPPPLGYNPDWQYNNQNSDIDRRRMAPLTSAMVPSSRNMQQDNMESRSQQTSERYHYQRYGQSQATAAPPPQVEEVAVPVMLCHTCSHCGQMRSAGFHRSNPVLPGKPMVPTLCRRCEKKLKSSYRSTSRYTHIRKCTADVPCKWPGECVHIDIEHDERRGRRRSREETYFARYSPSRPRVIRRESSQAYLGLRALQRPREESRTERRTHTFSLSPRRSSSQIKYTLRRLRHSPVVSQNPMRYGLHQILSILIPIGRLTEAPHAERVPGSSSSVRPLRLRRDPRESCIGLSRKNAGLGVKVDLPFESAFVLRGGARKRKLALYLIQGRTGRSFESVVVL